MNAVVEGLRAENGTDFQYLRLFGDVILTLVFANIKIMLPLPPRSDRVRQQNKKDKDF